MHERASDLTNSICCHTPARIIDQVDRWKTHAPPYKSWIYYGYTTPHQRSLGPSERARSHIPRPARAYNLMADHRIPSQQAHPIPSNTYPHPAPDLHPLHGQVQHVRFLIVLPAVVVYPCTSLFRTLKWLVMTSKAFIGRMSLIQWKTWPCKVKCGIHDTSTRPITM